MSNTYLIVGFNRYQSAKSEGFYLNLIENYSDEEIATGNNAGAFPIVMRAAYSESHKLLGVPMFKDAPATIEIREEKRTFAGNVSLFCGEIISIIPHPDAVKVAQAAANSDVEVSSGLVAENARLLAEMELLKSTLAAAPPPAAGLVSTAVPPVDSVPPAQSKNSTK